MCTKPLVAWHELPLNGSVRLEKCKYAVSHAYVCVRLLVVFFLAHLEAINLIRIICRV